MKTSTLSFSLLAALGIFTLFAPAAQSQVVSLASFTASGYSYSFSNFAGGTAVSGSQTLDAGWYTAKPNQTTTTPSWSSSITTFGTNQASAPNNGSYLFVNTNSQ